MIEKVYIVSNKENPTEDANIKSLCKALSSNGVNTKLSISSTLKGDLLAGENLEKLKEVTSKTWRGQNNRAPFRGEIASAYNHLQCWNDIVENKYSSCLILEDDVAVNRPETIKEEIEQILEDLNNIPEGWLACFLGRDTYLSTKGFVYEHTEIEVSENLVVPIGCKAGYSYLVSLNGAERLSQEDFSQNIYNISDYLTYVLQSSADSKIYSTIWNKCLFDEDKKINSLRGAKNSGLVGVKRPSKIKYYTVATKQHDGLDRLKQSAEYYGIDLNVIGLDSSWTDGDVGRLEHPGGGQKINILKKELQKLDDDDLILFVDGYDVIFLTGTEEIEQKWNNLTIDPLVKVIFGSEKAIWPDPSIADKFPESESEYRFLNSGNFMGKVKDLKKITEEEISDSGDDQLYYQHKFLSKKYGIQLDYKAEIFQCIAGCTDWPNIKDELAIKKDRITNVPHSTEPCVFHGNGSKSEKIKHNWFCNYLGGVRLNEKPTLIGQKNVFVGMPTMAISLFLEKFEVDSISKLESVIDLTFPKENCYLFICYDEYKNTLKTNDRIEEAFKQYKKVFIKRTTQDTYVSSRDECLKAAKKLDVDHYFYIDDHFNIEKFDIIENLLFLNKTYVGPLGENEHFSNYWGLVDDEGWYKESDDYGFIVRRENTGVWAGPYVFACYLLNRRGINELQECYSLNYSQERGSDMSFCSNALDRGIIPYIDNRYLYGSVTSF